MKIKYGIVRGNLRRNDNSRGAVLLMTATLNPPPGAVARFDPQERLADYATALNFYLDMPIDVIDRIVLADNSLGETELLREIAAETTHNKIVEIMSFEANDHPVSQGKAYGEFKLMDIAMTASHLIVPDDIIWKVTGRVRILNLERLHRAIAGRRPDIACDLYRAPLIGTGQWHNNRYMDLRVFAFRPGAYQRIYRGIWESASPCDAHALYRATIAARGEFDVMPRFPRQPWIAGVSGRHQRDYSSPRNRSKTVVRSFLRTAAPFLWI